MQSTEIKFISAGHELVGTLLVPTSAPTAAAVLVSGSGPIDRDSNLKRQKLNVMSQVAEHLASVGIATLRYDKRGVGASDGDYKATGLNDNIADADAALTALRLQAGMPSDLFVIGHSEGAFVAGALAASSRDLSGAVLLAGATHTGEEVLLWQAAEVAGSLPKPVKALLKVLRKDFLAIQKKRIAKLKESQKDVIRMQFIRVNAKWFREFLAHDPADSLRRARVPILAITGAKDVQVPPDDVALMADMVPTDFTGDVPTDVTHLLRRDGGPPGLKTYRKQMKRPVDRQLLEMVGAWVNDVAAGEKELHNDAI